MVTILSILELHVSEFWTQLVIDWIPFPDPVTSIPCVYVCSHFITIGLCLSTFLSHFSLPFIFLHPYFLCVKDDKRMERVKRRLDELELVQNNIKLMNELLSHYRPESGEEEKLLLQVHTCTIYCTVLSSMYCIGHVGDQ